MYTVDQNNVVTRNSDSKVIPRDVANTDYQTFRYIEYYKINPANGAVVTGFIDKRPASHK